MKSSHCWIQTDPPPPVGTENTVLGAARNPQKPQLRVDLGIQRGEHPGEDGGGEGWE